MGSQYDRQRRKAEDSSLAEALGLWPLSCNSDLQHRYDPLFSLPQPLMRDPFFLVTVCTSTVLVLLR